MLKSAYVKHKEKILPRDFYCQKTDIVARELLGKLIVHKTKKGLISAKIVETEAYFGNGEDPASHAHKGPTPRSAIMFGEVGHAYIYFNYGVHWLLNFVAKEDGKAGAVLIRAVQPVEGVGLMLKNRKTKVNNLTNGPAKLTQAFGLNGSYNGLDITKNINFYVADFITSGFEIVESSRIGISKGTSRLLRFYVKDNPFVSKI